MFNIIVLFSAVTTFFTGLTCDLVCYKYTILNAYNSQSQRHTSQGQDTMHLHRSSSRPLMTASSPGDPSEFTSIAALLEFPQRYHQKMVTVRGVIAQPEMHLDETELFFNFVFLLKEGEQSIVVFGQHDRTQGGSVIVMGNTVQVSGIFWKDRIAHDYHFKNNLEAITVTPYPSLIPNRT